MNISGNGNAKRVIVGVSISLIVLLVSGLIAAILRDGNRITVLETQMTTIERSLETNRRENNGAHDKIMAEIKDQGKTMDAKLMEILKELGHK